MLKRINVGRAVQQEWGKRSQKKKHFRPTAVAIVTNKRGHMLVVKGKSNDKWGPVKGGVEKREGKKPIQALLREVREEIGVCPEKQQVRYLGSVENHGFARAQKQHEYAVGKHFHCYRIALTARQVRGIRLCASELSGQKWIKSRQDLMQLDMPESRRTILAAIALQLNLPWAIRDN